MPRKPSSRPRVLAIVALLALVGSAAVAGCRPADGPEVILYVSADQHLARTVVKRFEEASGIRVRIVGDTEAKKTTGLVERLRSERGNPQADVFWSSEIFMTIALADEGVLDAYESPATRTWPAEHRDDEGRWYAFAARARVIAYAPDRVTAEDLPRAWTDLTRSYLRGRIVMADPRFGTTGGHLGAMKTYWDRNVMPGYYAAFVEGLRANNVRLLPSGNAGVVRAIAEGTADIGLTDTDDVWAARAQGWNIDLVYPPHNRVPEAGNGTLLIPNTVARVAGGANPEAAGRLIDFLLSEQTERFLAESVSRNVPLRAGLAESYPDTNIKNPLRVDYRRAAAEREDAVNLLMTIFTREDPPVVPREETGEENEERQEIPATPSDAG